MKISRVSLQGCRSLERRQAELATEFLPRRCQEASIADGAPQPQTWTNLVQLVGPRGMGCFRAQAVEPLLLLAVYKASLGERLACLRLSAWALQTIERSCGGPRRPVDHKSPKTLTGAHFRPFQPPAVQAKVRLTLVAPSTAILPLRTVALACRSACGVQSTAACRFSKAWARQHNSLNLTQPSDVPLGWLLRSAHVFSLLELLEPAQPPDPWLDQLGLAGQTIKLMTRYPQKNLTQAWQAAVRAWKRSHGSARCTFLSVALVKPGQALAKLR